MYWFFGSQYFTSAITVRHVTVVVLYEKNHVQVQNTLTILVKYIEYYIVS